MRLLVPFWLMLLGGCTHWIYPVEMAPTTVIRVRTADGWQVALHRHAPKRGVTARHHPVIVCHGVASNRHNWELGPKSFPRWLADQGFEVFSLELRGSGASDRPGLLDSRGWDYTFDDYVQQDLPAAIGWVAARTGRAHWVGHSMGGMVLYGYLERHAERWIRSAAVVGSPAFAPDHLGTLDDLLALYPVARALFDRLPSQSVARAMAPLAAPARRAEQHILWNPDNLPPAVARALAANAVEDLSGRVFDQMVDSARTRSLRSADGQWDYTAELGRVTTPMLFVAGVADGLAPPSRLIAAYDGVSSPDKALVIAGRANGFAHDYGHLDLVVGTAAPTEIWPRLRDWLVAHD